MCNMLAASFSTETGILYFMLPPPEFPIPAHFVNRHLRQFARPPSSLWDGALSSRGASSARLGQSRDPTALKGIRAQLLDHGSPSTRQSVSTSSVELLSGVCEVLNGSLPNECVHPSHAGRRRQAAHGRPSPDHFSRQSGNSFVPLHCS